MTMTTMVVVAAVAGHSQTNADPLEKHIDVPRWFALEGRNWARPSATNDSSLICRVDAATIPSRLFVAFDMRY